MGTWQRSGSIKKTLENIPGIGKRKKIQKMHITLACLCVDENEVEETEQNREMFVPL